jgi:hypothetical protein
MISKGAQFQPAEVDVIAMGSDLVGSVLSGERKQRSASYNIAMAMAKAVTQRPVNATADESVLATFRIDRYQGRPTAGVEAPQVVVASGEGSTDLWIVFLAEANSQGEIELALSSAYVASNGGPGAGMLIASVIGADAPRIETEQTVAQIYSDGRADPPLHVLSINDVTLIAAALDASDAGRSSPDEEEE